MQTLQGARWIGSMLSNPMVETFVITIVITFLFIIPRNFVVDPDGRPLGQLSIGSDLLFGFVAICLIVFFTVAFPPRQEPFIGVVMAYRHLVSGKIEVQRQDPILEVLTMLGTSIPIFVQCLLYERTAHTRTVERPVILWLKDVGAAFALFLVATIVFASKFSGLPHGS